MTSADKPSMAVIGGGLAGAAAGLAAVEAGCRVELFEQAEVLGGRAGSYCDPVSGELIDYCKHVALGCCREFRRFCRRAKLENCFERFSALPVIAPNGRRRVLSAAAWLPSPLARLPGLLRLGHLSLRERLGIAGALYRLAKNSALRQSAQMTFGNWLRRQRQTPQAIDYFWSPVVVSALADTVDNVAFSLARKVFCEAFMTLRDAGDLLLPRVPLREIFHRRLAAYLTEQAVKVHLAAPVKRLEGGRAGVEALIMADGARRKFDLFVVAVPWHRVCKLLSGELLSVMPDLPDAEQLEAAEITAVHLWFSRPVIPLSHAMLLGRLTQWVFCRADESGQYCQAVISASHRLRRRTPAEWSADVREELAAIWPAVGRVRLLREKTFVQHRAVFSPSLEAERRRPAQQTAISNLALAGDWTQTGWPATMEGAIISGRRAVNALLKRPILPPISSCYAGQ